MQTIVIDMFVEDGRNDVRTNSRCWLKVHLLTEIKFAVLSDEKYLKYNDVVILANMNSKDVLVATL